MCVHTYIHKHTATKKNRATMFGHTDIYKHTATQKNRTTMFGHRHTQTGQPS